MNRNRKGVINYRAYERAAAKTFPQLWIVVGLVALFFFLRRDKTPPGPTIVVKTLSATVNGRLYAKEGNSDDFQSSYVALPADDGSGDTVVLPWSEIKVDAHTYSAKELAEGMSFFNQFVADMKARNDPLYSEAARVQSQLTKNLTPEQAATLYQEMIRLQQASVKKKEAVAAPRTELETRPIYDYALRLKLREMGIDPDQASIVISDEEIEQERKQDRETRERTMEALRSLGARYAVVVNKEVFFSPEEPRPYGAGYKFRVLRGREFFRP